MFTLLMILLNVVIVESFTRLILKKLFAHDVVALGFGFLAKKVLNKKQESFQEVRYEFENITALFKVSSWAY